MITKDIEKMAGAVIGKFQDVLIPIDGGKPIFLPADKNIIVLDINKVIASLMKGDTPAYNFWWAVGTGKDFWDNGLPNENLNVDRHTLETEIARKFCSLRYLDPDTELPTSEITNVLEFKAVFEASEANGFLREFSIFSGDASATPDSGMPINWKAHAKIEKTSLFNLERRLQLWLKVNYDLL